MGFTRSSSTGSRKAETVRWWPILHIWSDKGLSQVSQLGGLTLDPAGMHCTSWDDAFVSSFIYYFNCISFAIRLSGRKVAIKLID